MADSLIFQGLQHFRLPCPSLSPGTCSNSCSVSQWCYLSISSSAAPFPFAFNLSQHQGLFQWGSCLHQVAKVLQLQLQHQSFQSKFKVDSLGLISLNSLQSKGLLRVFSSNTIWKLLWHSAFFVVQITPLYMTIRKKKTYLWLYGPLSAKRCL